MWKQEHEEKNKKSKWIKLSWGWHRQQGNLESEQLESEQSMVYTTEILWEAWRLIPHNLRVVWITHSHFLPLFMGAVN